jgi:hypothetical protein
VLAHNQNKRLEGCALMGLLLLIISGQTLTGLSRGMHQYPVAGCGVALMEMGDWQRRQGVSKPSMRRQNLPLSVLMEKMNVMKRRNSKCVVWWP